MGRRKKSGFVLAAFLVIPAAAGCPGRLAAPGEALDEAGRVRLVRGPFVQYLTPRGAVIEWSVACPPDAEGTCSRIVLDPETEGGWVSEPGVARVREEEREGLGRVVDHRARIDRLEEGRAYAYWINAGEISPIARQGAGPFDLGPLPSADRLGFAVLGDTGSGSEDQYGIAAVLDRESFSFGFIAGDLVAYPDGERDYDERYFAPYGRVLPRAPLYPVLGNHDIGQYWPIETSEVLALSIFDVFRAKFDEATGFRGPAPPRTYYSVAVGDVLFVTLDSNDALGDLYQPAEVHEGPGHEGCQWNWLRGELARVGFDWKFVIFHHPPYSSGLHAGRGGTASLPSYGFFHLLNGLGWAWNPVLGWTGARVPRAPVASDLAQLRAALTDLLAAGGVDIVFTSHDHDFEVSRPIRGYDEEAEEPVFGRGPTGDCPAGARPMEGECVFEKGVGPVYLVTGGGGRPIRDVARSAWTVTSFSEHHAIFVEIAGEGLTLRVEPQGLRYAIR